MKKLWKRIFKDKEMRKYWKMHKAHRKAMIKLAKADRDWDFDFMHELVVTKIKHMYEYYSAGYNICQSEESLDRILATLGHAIELADQIDNSRIWIEEELYYKFYSYIGRKILYWWD